MIFGFLFITALIELEKIMINCRAANNITHIEELRRDSNGEGYFADYKITYNER